MGATEFVPVLVPGRTKADRLVVVMTKGHYAGSYPGYRRCLVFYCVYCCSYLHSLEAMLISESE